MRSSSSSFGSSDSLTLSSSSGRRSRSALHLLVGERLQLGVVGGVGHLGGGGEFRLGAAQRFDAVHDRPELAVFLRQLGELGAADPGAGQRGAQLGVPAQQLVETRFEYPVHCHNLMIAASAATTATPIAPMRTVSRISNSFISARNSARSWLISHATG